MGDEGLALVCATIGGLQVDDDGNEVYVKSPECLESLRDLQRYLRRDHPETRDVFLQLGKWNIVRQDLVPIIKRYSDDFDLVLNCVKVLVFLTMPVDPLSHQVSQQIEYLQHFKAAIVEGDAIAVIVSHLEEPLQHLESGCPKDDDWKMFQLFLTLLRNFLSIPNCLPQHGPSTPQLSNLRDQMLERLFTESAIELVIALTQHVVSHGGLRQDNLLILEIVQQVFWGQRADLVAAAADKGAKLVKQSEKSAATLRAFLQSEREQQRRLRNGDPTLTGMFVQVARDGSKTILTRNPHQSPLENLIRKPQMKRGYIKRIVQEPNPVVYSSDNIYALLKDFADQFLASGYNILMQSVKEDIRRERSGFETPEIVAFFQVAQFFTSYQCCMAQKDEKNQRKSDGGFLDGPENEAAAQKHLCGLIASTMDEDMFTMVISKWHEYADSAPSTKDWGPAAAAGGTMKDMIRMLDVVLKRSGSLTKEGQQELRTARILLYKIFYDQTEDGLLNFVSSLIRSFDIYKQPRSHLADLVEITHIVLRILDSFDKAGESLRVLKKVRGGGKKKSKPASVPSETVLSEGAEQGATEASAGNKGPEIDQHASDSPNHVGVSTENLDREPTGPEESTENASPTHGEALPQEEQSAVELENKIPIGSHEEGEEEEENTHPAAAGDNGDDDDSDGEKQKGTKEVSFNIRTAVGMFATNVVVRNYCWLLKFHTSNRAAINHYIVRMLQRICEDLMLEPMLYQISILQTFYSILSNRQVQAAEDHRFVVAFLSKLVRRLFKKLAAHPILFVDILFWKTRTECHNITADYLIHTLRKETGGPSQNRQRINIADALGDDEEEAVPPMGRDSDHEGSAASSEEDDVQASEERNLFSEDQETHIRELFERYKDDEQKAELIASELDSSGQGQYTAAQVLRKLRGLGLVHRTVNPPKKKVGTGRSTNEKLQDSDPSTSQAGKARKGSTPAGGAPSRSRIFSKAQDQALRELFERHGSGKNVTKVITQNLGGDLTTAQVSRRLRTLGLVKSKPKTAASALHENLTDSEEDDDKLPRNATDSWQENGDAGLEQTGGKPKRKKRSKHASLLDSDDDDLPIGGLSREKQTGQKRTDTVDLVDSDDDVPIGGLNSEKQRRPRAFTGSSQENRNAGSDSDDDNVPIGGLNRVKPTRPRTFTDSSQENRNAGSDQGGEKPTAKKRTNTVHQLDSDDDVPIGGLNREKATRPRTFTDSSQENRNAGLDQRGERPTGKKRTNSVNLLELVDSKEHVHISGEEDLPTTGLRKERHLKKRRAENTVQLFDGEEDAPISSGLRSENQTKSRSLSNEDLFDLEDDVQISGFSRENHNRKRRITTVDSDDDDVFPIRVLD